MLASLSLQKIFDEGNTQAFWKKYKMGLFLTAGIFGVLDLLLYQLRLYQPS